MLDYNHSTPGHHPTPGEQVAAMIDQALQSESSQQPRRAYLGASRLGAPCARQLQYEFSQAFLDPESQPSGRILRVFEVGHNLEDLAIRWLRLAGIQLITRTNQGEQLGFSVCDGQLQGHVDGIITDAPDILGWHYPMLFECKTMKAAHWRDCAKRGLAVSKPLYAAQIALYQAYMEEIIAGISRHPCLFLAINKDSQELYCELIDFDPVLAQRTSDRAVQILDATEHGERLPRSFADPSHFECRYCPWAARCWRDT